MKTTLTTDDELKEDDGNNVAFAFQVNPIGIRVGKQVASFAELGAGVKGFVSLGLSATF